MSREELILKFNRNYERSLSLSASSDEFKRLLAENERLCELITGDHQ